MVNKRIIALREELGLSQKDLAQKINLNVSVMNRIEVGTRPMRDDEIKTLANFFNVSTDYLLGNSNVRSVIETTAAHMLNPYEEFDADTESKIKEYIELMRLKVKKEKGNS